MKALGTTLQRALDHDRVRFFGNVTVGTDVTIAELLGDYHAVVYSYGAATDRRLGIPGEDLPGSLAAQGVRQLVLRRAGRKRRGFRADRA